MAYLEKLIKHAEKYGLDFRDILDDAKSISDVLTINLLIYSTLHAISNLFIDELPKSLQDKARDTQEIHCNYTDSHVRFANEEISKYRENSKYFL